MWSACVLIWTGEILSLSWSLICTVFTILLLFSQTNHDWGRRTEGQGAERHVHRDQRQDGLQRQTGEWRSTTIQHGLQLSTLRTTCFVPIPLHRDTWISLPFVWRFYKYYDSIVLSYCAGWWNKRKMSSIIRYFPLSLVWPRLQSGGGRGWGQPSPPCSWKRSLQWQVSACRGQSLSVLWHNMKNSNKSTNTPTSHFTAKNWFWV